MKDYSLKAIQPSSVQLDYYSAQHPSLITKDAEGHWFDTPQHSNARTTSPMPGTSAGIAEEKT